jgi:dTDP-4-amino-4,6-dideoxygalactose transaminase
LNIALQVLVVEKGDTVLCSTFTFAARAFPVKYLGANLVFVDSERETWNICPDLLVKAIEGILQSGIKPKAILLVNAYGVLAQMERMVVISETYGIPIIEDAAAALGASYKGNMCGTFGDFGILSFNGNKILTTSGGGALICKNEEIKKKAIYLATQAKDNTPHYQHSEIGYNYRMSNIVAGIGRGQMEVLDTHIGYRRNMHQFYAELFKDVPGITVFKESTNDSHSNHWLSCIVMDPTKTNLTPDSVREVFLEENIE